MATQIEIKGDDQNGEESLMSLWKSPKFPKQRGNMSFTEPLETFTASAGLLSNEAGSIEMAVDASISGTPDVVYLDEPTTNWTNSALSGTWDFASTAVTPQGGTESIDATLTVNGDQMQIEKTSTVDLASFAGISGWLFLTSWNDTRHSIQLEVREAGIIVGTSIDINDLVDTGVLNTWQQFFVPKSDMGLNGSIIDQLIFTTSSTSGAPPNYYLDTINIEETGGEFFSFGPPPGAIFEIWEVMFTFFDNVTVIEPGEFLGAGTLANGIRVRTRINNQTAFAAGLKSFAEIMSVGGKVLTPLVGTTETAISIISTPPGATSRLDGDTNDCFSLFVSDDLSALTSFRTIVRGKLLD